MRIISLNTWGGRSLQNLMEFFQFHESGTDVFCLQEMFHTSKARLRRRHPHEYVCADLFSLVRNVLPHFDGYFAGFRDNPDRMSQAMFVRKGGPPLGGLGSLRTAVIHRPRRAKEHGSAVYSERKAQVAYVHGLRRGITIVNYHGLWDGGPKTDTPDRIKQSQKLASLLQQVKGPKVLCGDLNLEPDTQSLIHLEKSLDMVNLVGEHGITSTRTANYRHFNSPAHSQFADYMLVSRDVVVEGFRVLPTLASDHAALLLDIKE